MAFHRRDDNERNHIFMVICDIETMEFCQENFASEKDQTFDVRVLRASDPAYDFALLTSCNGTIVSNTDLGVLHALMNGGTTVVRRPEAKDEPEFYIPWLISEQMPNWYAID